jgi:simple sugar transport system permease protein
MTRSFVKWGLNSLPLLAGLILALLVISLLLAEEGVSLREVWGALYDGAWSDAGKQARVVRVWLPLLLCSTGLLLTFTAGLWNIGIEGQITMGAIGATSIALFVRYDDRALQLLMQFTLAFLAGGAWGLVAAILKTRGGINEIFGGVALNFIAFLFAAFLISNPFAPESGGTGSRTAAFDPFTLLPARPIERAFISDLGLGISLGSFALVVFILGFTRWGLELRAIGKNTRSAHALGLPTERHIWLAMALCGGLAGLGGAILVLHPPTGQLQSGVSGGIGFLALLVVLLASLRAFLVPLIAFAFAFLGVGAQRVESSLQVDPSLVNLIQGVLVFFVLLFDGLRQSLEARQAERLIALETARQGQEASKTQGDA